MNVKNARIHLFRTPNPTKNDKYTLYIDLEVGGLTFSRCDAYKTQRDIYIDALSTLDWLEHNGVNYKLTDHIKIKKETK